MNRKSGFSIHLPRTLTLLLMFMAPVTGTACSQQETEPKSKSNQVDGDKNVITQETSEDYFVQHEWAPIEFEPQKRAVPSSVKVALDELDSIKTLYGWQNIPTELNQDFSFETVHEYAKAWRLLNDQLPADIQWLEAVKPMTFSDDDGIDSQRLTNGIESQLTWLRSQFPTQMKQSATYSRQFLIDCVEPYQWQHITKAAECDMEKSTEVANVFGRPELNELRVQQINRIRDAFASLRMFDEIMKLSIDSEISERQSEFEKVIERYQQKLAQSSDAIQLPDDIGDDSLRAIAKDVLAKKEYQLPPAVKLVVNAPVRSFGKEHYTIDFSERSIEKSDYQWEEFQVATIEKHGDHHFLYFNTIIRYSVGPKTVPTKEWVLGPRHRSAPIAVPSK